MDCRTIYIKSKKSKAINKKTSDITLTSIDELKKIKLMPNDTIAFEGGKTFAGCLNLKNFEGPLNIISIGTTPAVINAGNYDGIILNNCKNILIAGLRIKGSGWRKNENGIGIEISGCHNIKILNNEIFGFRKIGILYQKASTDISIIGCFLHDLGCTGIEGEYGKQPNRNIYIAHCKVYEAAGDSKVYKSHTGSGIIIAFTHNGVVEFCETSGNGWAQRQRKPNGPIGIWCWGNCKDVVFRWNISRDNRTQPGGVDGGGLDFDGGVVDCLMEYNYSYNNEGAGYLLCEFGSKMKWDNNIVNYCLSINDSVRVKHYAAVHFFGPEFGIISNGVVKNSLLVSASDRNSVINTGVVKSCVGNAVVDNIMVTDGKPALESETSYIHSENNIEIIDKKVHADIINNAPRLTDPRYLTRMPVFEYLAKGNCAKVLQSKGAKAIFGVKEREERKFGKVILDLRLDGLDLEGCEYEGDIKLYYDSIKPGLSSRFNGKSCIITPTLHEENGMTYLLRAKARLQNPNVVAYMFFYDKNSMEIKEYFTGTSGEYHYAQIEFSGKEKYGRYIGIQVENNEGCLFVDSMEIIEIGKKVKANKEKDLNDLNSWRSFGDVERGYDDEFCIKLNDVGSSITRDIQRRDEKIEFIASCKAINNATATMCVESGNERKEIDIKSSDWQEYSVSLKPKDEKINISVSQFSSNVGGSISIKDIKIK